MYSQTKSTLNSMDHCICVVVCVRFHFWPGKIKLSSSFKRNLRKAPAVYNQMQRTRKIFVCLINYSTSSWNDLQSTPEEVTKFLGKTKSNTLTLQSDIYHYGWRPGSDYSYDLQALIQALKINTHS